MQECRRVTAAESLLPNKKSTIFDMLQYAVAAPSKQKGLGGCVSAVCCFTVAAACKMVLYLKVFSDKFLKNTF